MMSKHCGLYPAAASAHAMHTYTSSCMEMDPEWPVLMFLPVTSTWRLLTSCACKYVLPSIIIGDVSSYLSEVNWKILFSSESILAMSVNVDIFQSAFFAFFLTLFLMEKIKLKTEPALTSKEPNE